MSTQTVTTTTCDACGKVKPDLGEEVAIAGWTVLKLATPDRTVVVDVDSHGCAGELLAKLMLGEIGEPIFQTRYGEDGGQIVPVDIEPKPVLPTRLTNRCPIGATNASQCWDELPRNQTCQKHGTPAGRDA